MEKPASTAKWIKTAFESSAPAPSVTQVQNLLAGEKDQIRRDALRNVGNLFLASLGVGAAARGGVGLVNLFRQQKPKDTRSGPALLPLPYPVQSEEMPGKIKAANGLIDHLTSPGGSSRSSIPLYGPGMMLAGIGGLGLGWKGLDSVLNERRRKATEEELNAARQEFNDALLSQWSTKRAEEGAPPCPKCGTDETWPVSGSPGTAACEPCGHKFAYADSPMRKAGAALDRAFEQFSERIKTANTLGDWIGKAENTYLTGATLAALLSGTLVYDKMKKRSRRAVLEKALQQRQRQSFAQRPTEIYAVPTPISQVPKPDFREDMKAIAAPPGV